MKKRAWPHICTMAGLSSIGFPLDHLQSPLLLPPLNHWDIDGFVLCDLFSGQPNEVIRSTIVLFGKALVTATTIQKSAKLERVKQRLLAAVSKLEESVDTVPGGSSKSQLRLENERLKSELDKTNAEGSALREAAAESDALRAEIKALRDANAEAARRIAATIGDLRKSLDE